MVRFGAALPAWPVAALVAFCALTAPVAADPATEGAPSAAKTTEPAAGPAATPAEAAPAPAPTGATAAEAPKPADAAATPEATTAAAEKANSTKSGTEKADAVPPAADKAPEASAAQPAAETTAAASVAPPVDPVIAAVRAKLDAKEGLEKAFPEQIAALKAFYAARSEPLWIKAGTLTDKAQASIAEIKKADDYGLEAAKYQLPELNSGADAAAQAEAELKLDVAALTYAHDARGGRIDPLSLSNILDMKPPVKEPATVLDELAAASAPDAYLRDQNPKHPQFEKLRQALLKARGPQEEPVDEALAIKIPATRMLKPGDEDPAVALLRKRLKVEAQEGSNPNYYDAALEVAVKAFQKDGGLRPDGLVGSGTRRALNGEGDHDDADPQRQVDRIIANMERWRWMPENLGSVYVVNNIPEFKSRIFKGQEMLLEQKMIVGQPSWPTPVLAATMQSVVFHPSWGVPDGIKTKELLPRLKRAGGGTNFFDQLFGGGSSGGGRVLRAYKLEPSLNGRPVDADSIDWNNVDIRRFSFVQPPGSQNPLGNVKFMFPNRHDVYMHDTPQKNLFGQTFRALSHGCMRLDEPRRTAEVILAEDKGWSPEKVDDMYDHSTNTVSLDKPVPVYLAYFTLMVDDSGKPQRFGDIYGHDQRVTAALAGRPVRYFAPENTDDVAGADSDAVPEPTRKKASKKTTASSEPAKKSTGDIMAESLSGLLGN